MKGPASVDINSLPLVASEILSLFFVLSKDRLSNYEIATELGREEGNVNKVVRRLIVYGLLSEEPRGIYNYYFIPDGVRKQKIDEKIIDAYLDKEWPTSSKSAPAFLKRIISKAVDVALSRPRVRISYNVEIPGQVFGHRIDLQIELESSKDKKNIPVFVLLADKTLTDRLYQFAGERKDLKLQNTNGIVVILVGSVTKEQVEYLKLSDDANRRVLMIVQLSKGPFSEIIPTIRERLARYKIGPGFT